jgi:hypothetical protein
LREGGDVFVHALGEGCHLLASRGERVAGAVPLEQRDPEGVLDLSQVPEHRRVVHPEPLGRSRQTPRIGDGLDETEVVPGQVPQRVSHRAVLSCVPMGCG